METSGLELKKQSPWDVLKISQNSLENTCAGVSFLIDLQKWPQQMFSCKFCEIFKNTIFKRKSPVAASKARHWNWNNGYLQIVACYCMPKSETYSEPCHTSNMERFVKIVNGFQLKTLTIFTKHSILDVDRFWIRLWKFAKKTLV